MNLKPGGRKAVQVLLNPRGQTSDKLQEVMSALLGLAGCQHCGRMIRLDVEFGSDPGPEASESGVISATEG